MKTMFRTTLTALLACALAPLMLAADPDYGFYSEQALTASQTNQVVIFNAPNTTTTKQIVLQAIDVTGDNAADYLYFYGGTLGTTINATLGTSITNVTVASTNGFAPGDYIVIQRAAGTSTWHEVYNHDTGHLDVYPAVGTACASGDYVYRMSNVSRTLVGSATLRLSGNLFGAQIRMPLAIRIGATSGAGTSKYINNATVLYSEDHLN